MTEVTLIQDNGLCFICGNPALIGTDWAIKTCKCRQCGNYGFDATSFELAASTAELRSKLAGWIHAQNRVSIDPIISLEDFRRIKDMRIPGLRDRSMILLRMLCDDLKVPHRYFSISSVGASSPDLLGASYSKTLEELELLLSILGDEGCLLNKNGAWSLSTRGILQVEAAARSGDGTSQGFVAMSFSSDLTPVWIEGFDPAIRDAGFSPMRIDGKEYLGGISDEVIAEIRNSNFVVADYTLQRNNVYFEVGFALGLGLRVIPTVRADEHKNLHFDIRHLNTIEWENPSDLRKKLSKRIEAVIGRGPGVA